MLPVNIWGIALDTCGGSSPKLPGSQGYAFEYPLYCRSVQLLGAAADGLEGLLQPQRFHAPTFIMLFGQLEALLKESCLLHHTAASSRLQNGNASVKSEVRSSLLGQSIRLADTENSRGICMLDRCTQETSTLAAAIEHHYMMSR